MKQIIIDARYKDETRVATIGEKNELLGYEVESVYHTSIRSNIYVAQVERIEASMQAFFINYGADKHGFLSFLEIRDNLFGQQQNSQTIVDEIKVGQKLLVQAIKDARGAKCAAFTTFIAVPSRYCILIPYATKQRIVSKKIFGAERARLEHVLESISIPDGLGCIVRTSGQDRNKSELRRDFEYLLRIWDDMQPIIQEQKIGIVYEEGDIVKRTVRDLFDKNTKKIIIQGKSVYHKAKKFMRLFMPSSVRKIVQHKDENTDVFNIYDINNKVESMLNTTIDLPSGGNIVIEQTEALTSIDVNSGKMRTETDTDATAIATNMEACEVIANQVRLRDISGIVVIDFIDMLNKSYITQVEQKMFALFKDDYANVKVGKISQFGLMEMSRQRLRSSMVDINFTNCPCCHGQGRLLHYNTICMFVIRRIDEFLLDHHKEASIIKVEVCHGSDNYLLNYKRETIRMLEEKYDVTILIYVNTSSNSLDCTISVKTYRPELYTIDENTIKHTATNNTNRIKRNAKKVSKNTMIDNNDSNGSRSNDNTTSSNNIDTNSSTKKLDTYKNKVTDKKKIVSNNNPATDLLEDANTTIQQEVHHSKRRKSSSRRKTKKISANSMNTNNITDNSNTNQVVHRQDQSSNTVNDNIEKQTSKVSTIIDANNKKDDATDITVSAQKNKLTKKAHTNKITIKDSNK